MTAGSPPRSAASHLHPATRTRYLDAPVKGLDALIEFVKGLVVTDRVGVTAYLKWPSPRPITRRTSDPWNISAVTSGHR